MALPRPFSELGCISKPTLAVLDSLGFVTATPVQEATIPLFCGHKDVAVDACTGSGKTLAFVIPVIEKLRRLDERLKPHQVGGVIVSPTRELAQQTAAVAAPFVASVRGLSSLLLVGGTDPTADVAAFRESGGNLLIGTPGRLEDVMKRCGPAMDARRLEVLVLDEADRLLDMGFRAQLDAIMGRLPKQRRTGLFSATQTDAVEALARAGLRNPVKVAVAVAPAAAAPAAAAAAAPAAAAAAQSSPGAPGGAEAQAQARPGLEQATPSSLVLQYMVVPVEQKLAQLVAFLAAHARDKAIAYLATCAAVEFTALALRRLPQLAGLRVCALHGRLKQAAREATLAAFAAASAGVLLATDVAARGLDIPNVAWVLQYDPPQDPAAFVHRVGRTARMGRSGSALALLAPNEAAYVQLLALRKVHLAETPLQTGAPDAGELAAFLRSEAESDREVMEKGSRAFVSLLRAYKEHHCSYVFRLQELPLGPLAQSMGLLRLPRAPETRKGSAANALAAFVPSPVEPGSVRFRDKAREKQRQRLLKQLEQQQQAEAAAGPKQAPQPQAQQVQWPDAAGPRLTAAKRRQLQGRDDAAELAHDYALLRALKRGKISERAFNVAAGLSSGDDESEGGEGGEGSDPAGAREPQPSRAAAAAGAAVASSSGGSGKAGKRKQRKQAAGASGGSGGPGSGAALGGGPAPTVVQAEAQLRKRKKRRAKKRRAAAGAARAT